jgi:anti-sigma28 factor (negative regulator of flagellin synthesis)
MMSTEIVNEIARLMAQRDLSLKDPKDAKQLKAAKGLSTPKDEVILTASAQSYASAGTPEAEMERDQAMKVERLKALVGSGSYKMDQHTVESIAERIANTLL